MAVITITEILGGDNIAGSRVTINDNFKRLASAINTIETRLDTSFNPGGSLNVGNALIRKYTNPTTAQIFTCEATGQFQGNLNILLDAGISGSLDVGLDANVHRNVNFDGAAIGGPWAFTSSIRSNFTNEFVQQQLAAATVTAPLVDPQALLPLASLTRAIPSVIGHSVLRIDMDTYTGAGNFNCDTITLPTVGLGGCTPGQVLHVVLESNGTGPAPIPGGFQLDSTPFASGYNANIVLGFVTNTNTTAIRKLALTLFADANGWRVLNVTQAVAGDITY